MAKFSGFDQGDERSLDWRIRRAAASMRAETRRGAALDTYAKEAGLSRSHFFRLFESSIGVPPKVYLNVYYHDAAGWHFWKSSAPFGPASNWAQASYTTPAIPAGADLLSIGFQPWLK